MRHASLLAAAALIAVVPVTGCSKSKNATDARPSPSRSASPTVPAGPLTRAQLAEQAGAICKEFEKRYNDVPQPGTDANSQTATVQKLNELVEEEIGRLSALKPPSEDQAAMADFVSLFRQSLSRTVQASAALMKGDQAAGEAAIASVNTLNQQLNKVGVSLGLKGCSGGAG